MKRLRSGSVKMELFGSPYRLSMEPTHVRRRVWSTAIAGGVAGGLIVGTAWLGIDMASRGVHAISEKLEQDQKEYVREVLDRHPAAGAKCVEFAYGTAQEYTPWGLAQIARDHGYLDDYSTLDGAATDVVAVIGDSLSANESFAACDGEVYNPSNVPADQLGQPKLTTSSSSRR